MQYDCPMCGKTLHIPDEYAGKAGNCNACGEHFVVPLVIEEREEVVLQHEFDKKSDAKHLMYISRLKWIGSGIVIGVAVYWICGLVKTGTVDAPQSGTNETSLNQLVTATDIPAREVLEYGNIPKDISSRILDLARRQWPDNARMQVVEQNKQIAAYILLQQENRFGVPQKVFEVIQEKARREAPDKFHMRVYHEEKQVEAYLNLQRGNHHDLPRNIFDLIREKARRDWPDDFAMQYSEEQDQTFAYIDLQRGNVHGVPQEIFDLIRERARFDWPDDFTMQEYWEKKTSEEYMDKH